ncbi:MAG: hypothetical protein HOG79_15325, partial [Prolixibacteraceae bacterium]|nr:hypothetical protein [Prolixibacteraceae bacterium]
MNPHVFNNLCNIASQKQVAETNILNSIIKMLYKEFKKQGDFLFRYRGSLPIIILVFGFGIFILTRLNSGNEGNFFQTGTFMIIGLAVSLFGQLIRILTVGFTPANTSGRNKHLQVADEINTTGIYSVVRH